jgi:hypothetical protein
LRLYVQEQSCHAGGVRCSEKFAEVLMRNAHPAEFCLDPAGEVEMEDG